jgi:hypothetical protein
MKVSNSPISTAAMELAASQFASARPHLAGLFQQVLTVDAIPVNLATVSDSDATLAGQPSGKKLKVYVIAANDAGQAAPSDTVTIVVP